MESGVETETTGPRGNRIAQTLLHGIAVFVDLELGRTGLELTDGRVALVVDPIAQFPSGAIENQLAHRIERSVVGRVVAVHAIAPDFAQPAAFHNAEVLIRAQICTCPLVGIPLRAGVQLVYLIAVVGDITGEIERGILLR